MLGLLIEDQPHRARPDLRRKLVACLLAHGSTFSRVGASGKPGAVQYHIPPHTHPKPEVVTILSGTLRLGEGAIADQSKANPLPAGSFFVMSPGMRHYVYADEETVLQLNSNGPWGLTYVNEKDDPRKTQ